MAVYSIGLIAHAGAGKTSLGEALLYRAGALKKLGAVDAGTSALDFDPVSRERRSSVTTAVGHCAWNGHALDLIDTPGSMNFIGATLGAIRVVDGAVMMASAEP
ncbi:MAG TPA: GTP-binding protein, partial [bacterium]